MIYRRKKSKHFQKNYNRPYKLSSDLRLMGMHQLTTERPTGYRQLTQNRESVSLYIWELKVKQILGGAGQDIIFD